MVLEAPPINAIKGAFSASIVLIALVVLCDQDLLGRLSFDSVGRVLRPKSKSSIQMNGKSCKAKLRSHTVALVSPWAFESASSSSRESSHILSKNKNSRHYATAGPAFCRSASSKINGAFDLTNSVRKSRSSVENPSTLNHLTAGRKHSAWSKRKSTGRSTATRTVPSSLA